MKKVLALVLALCMVFALCACGSSTSTSASTTTAAATEAPAADAAATTEAAASTDKVGATVLKCAFNQSATNPEAQTLYAISDALYDATEGRYSIEVYPDASLGDQASTLELCTSGALDMTLVGNAVVESYDSDFAIIGTPYVYDSDEHQEKVFESGKLDDLFATTEQYGFNVLSVYSLGPRNLYLAKAPVAEGEVVGPDDVQGLKIRVMGSDTCIAMWKAMSGTDGISMAQGDVYSAIQTGTLDGAENNIITYTDLVQYEVAPNYVYTGHLMVPDLLCISNTVLSSMSEADQAALRQVCKDSIPTCHQLCCDLRASYEEEAASHGVTFFDADVSAFQAACADLINEKAAASDMTQSVYDAIVSLR